MDLLRTFLVQMRTMATAGAAAGIVLIGAIAAGQDLTLGAKPLPGTKDVAEIMGQSLEKMFAKFGVPCDVSVDEPKSKSPGVNVSYNKFAFVVRKKIVTECEFGSDWPGPVFGATIGDSADDIVKEMGTPNEDIKNANGTEMMVWNTKDAKSKVSITFNKQHKSDALFLDLK
jgi:hypothetical protein